jgi:hypothetical protein
VKALVVVASVATAVLAARPAAAKGCHEISDVVGIEKCQRFGGWSRESSMPRLWLNLDFLSDHMPVAPFTLGAAAQTVGSSTPRDSSATMLGYMQSVHWAFTPLLYTGFDLGWGWMTNAPAVVGPPVMHGMEFTTHSLIGAHVERFRIAVAGELALGPQLLAFDNCPFSESTCPSRQSATQTTVDLQARVRVDLFLHPNMSLGVTYGQSLLDATGHTLMIGIGIHPRAIDGMW